GAVARLERAREPSGRSRRRPERLLGLGRHDSRAVARDARSLCRMARNPYAAAARPERPALRAERRDRSAVEARLLASLGRGVRAPPPRLSSKPPGGVLLEPSDRGRRESRDPPR